MAAVEGLKFNLCDVGHVDRGKFLLDSQAAEAIQPSPAPPIFFRISHVDFGRAVPSNWHVLSALFVAAIAIGSTPPGRRGSAELS